MAAVVAELDKTFASAISDGYGTMSIRVVVLKKRQDDAAPDDEPEVPADVGDEEVLPTSGKAPVSGYLEDPKRGKECCVFLINGQRQDAWDNAFIVRDLDKKYLRNRMLIIVDLDGLKLDAVAELMSGDRQGFFQGKVYHAISTRLMATLKKDPDLERLEEDAEREISELRTGDEAVKQALDQLIEAHHAHADRVHTGHEQPGPGGTPGMGFGRDKPNVVVVEPQDVGTPTSGPYLVASPAAAVIRLHPSEPTHLTVTTAPPTAWKELGPLQVHVAPVIDGLTVEPVRESDRAKINLSFEEPDDWEDDQYPVEAVLRVTAMIKGHDDPRLLERRILISKPKKRKSRPPPILQDDPTFIRVTSRQPVLLTPGGADTHVRLRWDGKDHLAFGAPPLWTFRAHCVTLPSFPPMTFSKPSGGRFELLIQAPPSLSAGEELQFEVEALGPGEKTLPETFTAQVIAPPAPRKVKKIVPEPSSQRKPPYELLYINKTEWEKPCWDDEPWTIEDAGCFQEPTESKPLSLIINEDMGLLREYQDGLKSKKLEPSTVKERVTRYTSHVAFHLYQMYLNYRTEQQAQSKDSTVKLPAPEQMRGEINRVAATLIKVMQVSR
jgi:hypothetical protein